MICARCLVREECLVKIRPSLGGRFFSVVGSLGPPPEAARALQYIPEAAAVAYEWF